MKLGTKVLARIILMAAVATAVFGFTFASAEDYGIYVAEKEITSDNASDVLGDGTVSYDVATSTLTLKDANITGAGYGIKSYSDITVTGTATIETKYASIYVYEANLTIKDATITCDSEEGNAIYTEFGDMVIDNSTIDVTSDNYSYAISVTDYNDKGGNLTIKNSTIIVGEGWIGIQASQDLTIEKSEITIKADDYGIVSDEGNITINDTTIDIESGDSGIYAYKGCIDINGSTIDVESGDICIYVEYGKEDNTIKDSKLTLKDTAYDDGIQTSNSNLLIENSTVNIETGEDGISTSETICIVDSIVTINSEYGIYTWTEDEESTASVVIKGSEVSITSKYYAIDVHNLEVTDSIINCESEEYGLLIKNSMVVNSGYIHISTEQCYALEIDNEIVFEKPYGIYSPSDAKFINDGEELVLVPADVEEYLETYDDEKGAWSDNACHDVIITAEFTVTWTGADDKAIATDKYIYGQTPEFKGTEPTKAADDKYTYEFTGWDKEISKVTGDVTYKAVFKAIEKAAAPADKPKDVAPKTGDATNVLALMGIAVLAMAGAVVARRRA